MNQKVYATGEAIDMLSLPESGWRPGGVSWKSNLYSQKWDRKEYGTRDQYGIQNVKGIQNILPLQEEQGLLSLIVTIKDAN